MDCNKSKEGLRGMWIIILMVIGYFIYELVSNFYYTIGILGAIIVFAYINHMIYKANKD